MSDTQKFALSAEHVAIVRAFSVGWNSLEFGAPTVDPKRPLGNGDVVRDLATLLYGDSFHWLEDHEGFIAAGVIHDGNAVHRLRMLYRDTETALQIILATGSFEPGEYESDHYCRNWRRVSP